MHKLLTNNPRGAQILNLTTGKLRKLEMGSYRWLNSTRPPENLPLLLSSKNWHKMWSLIIWNRRSQKCVATVIFRTWIQCINEPFRFNLIICFLGFYHDLRQQRFPIYFFRSSLSLPSRFLLFSSYPDLTPLEAKVHYNSSTAQSIFPQYANKHRHLIHRREA